MKLNIVKNRLLITSVISLVMLASVFVSLTVSGNSVYAAGSKKPAKVKLKSVKASSVKITVKWEKAKNAKKYQVYQKTESGKWKLKKTLKKLTLTVKGSYGTSYSFKVRGVNGNKKGNFSAVRKIVVPKKEEEPVKPEEPEKSDDEKAADEVTAMILALPDFDVLTLDDSDAVDDARTAYNALSDEAKTFVNAGALQKLGSLEQTLADLIAEQERIDEENKEAADVVSGKIMQLFVQVYDDDLGLAYSDAKKVEALRAEYEALTDAQKVFVSKEATLSVLEELEEMIAEYRELLAASFVDWDKVTVGGIEFFKVTEDNGKTLLLACDVVRDSSGDPLLMEYGGSAVWKDSYVREYLNGEYLEEHPALDVIALETELKTRRTTDEGVEFIPTTDRIFLMTLADICGAEYSSMFKETYDYTHNGAVLPGLENSQVILDDDELLFWGRDEYINVRGCIPVMNLYMFTHYLKSGFYMTYNGYSYLTHSKACLLPALWVETDKLSERGELND